MYNDCERRRKDLISILAEIIKIGDFTLTSGLKSNCYIDCKEVMLIPYVMKTISNCIWDNYLINCEASIAGITSGADPIVCGMVAHHDMNGLFIRKSQKEYGMKKSIEGDFEEGQKVIIVDDVLTTGTSLKYAFDALNDHKLIPKGIIVLIDRQENNALDIVKEYTQIPVECIIKKEELINYDRDEYIAYCGITTTYI